MSTDKEKGPEESESTVTIVGEWTLKFDETQMAPSDRQRARDSGADGTMRLKLVREMQQEEPAGLEYYFYIPGSHAASERHVSRPRVLDGFPCDQPVSVVVYGRYAGAGCLWGGPCFLIKFSRDSMINFFPFR